MTEITNNKFRVKYKLFYTNTLYTLYNNIDNAGITGEPLLTIMRFVYNFLIKDRYYMVMVIYNAIPYKL